MVSNTRVIKASIFVIIALCVSITLSGCGGIGAILPIIRSIGEVVGFVGTFMGGKSGEKLQKVSNTITTIGSFGQKITNMKQTIENFGNQFGRVRETISGNHGLQPRETMESVKTGAGTDSDPDSGPSYKIGGYAPGYDGRLYRTRGLNISTPGSGDTGFELKTGGAGVRSNNPINAPKPSVPSRPQAPQTKPAQKPGSGIIRDSSGNVYGNQIRTIGGD